MQSRELRKSKENRLIRGTIAGIGEYFGLSRDVITFLRILYVILTFSSFFAGVIVYIIASWIIPDAKEDGATGYSQKQDWEQHGGTYQQRYAEKMARKQAKYEEKARRKADKWDSGWEDHPTKPGQKIKEAKPVDKDDDWSDF